MTRAMYIDTQNSILKLYEDCKEKVSYTVSISKFGIGNESGSYKTPLGKHAIFAKIGDGAPIGAIFQARKNIKIISRIYKKREDYPYDGQADCITTRILWLEGLEEGFNKGGTLDTKDRKVYIHGTPYEYDMGVLGSFGCVRMRNEDVIELFNMVEVSDRVELL